MKNENKKKTVVTLVGVIALLLVVIGATYAYFQAQMGDGATTDVNVQADTTDSLTFKSSNDITINATNENFAEGAGNQTGESTLTATLIANSTNQTAVYSYYLYLQIAVNDFTYTVDSNKPELLLSIYNEEGTEVTNISGLTYKTVTDGKGEQQKGFDITTKTGLVQLAYKAIEASPDTEGQAIHNWRAKVTLVNLDVDQNKNTGKTFNAKLTIQAEKINVFNNSLTSSTYRSVDYKDKIKNVYFVDYIDDDLDANAVANWDFSTDKDQSIMAWIENNNMDEEAPYNLYIGSERPIKVTSFASAFYNMSKVETIDLGDNLDTYLMNDTSYMFYFDQNLKTINGINDLDVSSVKNMAGMFGTRNWNEENKLTELNLENWNVSNVTNMSSMFYATRNLTTVGDLSNWDVSNVIFMNSMFYSSAITELNIENWDVSNVTDMSSMFSSTNLNSLDLSKWNVSKVTNMNSMFYAVKSLTTLDLSNWDTSSVNDMSGMFNFANNLTTMDLSRWDTSSVIKMNDMFHGTSSLTSVGNIGDWDVSQVQNMNCMFSSTNLNSLDLSKWDVSSVNNMGSMFSEASNLITIGDINNWNVSQVKDMNHMFNNILLTELNLKNWNVSNVTSMGGMFGNTKNLTTLDLSNWNTSQVENMSYMFESSNLTDLKMNNATFNNVTTYNRMFFSHKALLKITVNQASHDWLIEHKADLSLTIPNENIIVATE